MTANEVAQLKQQVADLLNASKDRDQLRVLLRQEAERATCASDALTALRARRDDEIRENNQLRADLEEARRNVHCDSCAVPRAELEKARADNEALRGRLAEAVGLLRRWARCEKLWTETDEWLARLDASLAPATEPRGKACKCVVCTGQVSGPGIACPRAMDAPAAPASAQGTTGPEHVRQVLLGGLALGRIHTRLDELETAMNGGLLALAERLERLEPTKLQPRPQASEPPELKESMATRARQHAFVASGVFRDGDELCAVIGCPLGFTEHAAAEPPQPAPVERHDFCESATTRGQCCYHVGGDKDPYVRCGQPRSAAVHDVEGG